MLACSELGLHEKVGHKTQQLLRASGSLQRYPPIQNAKEPIVGAEDACPPHRHKASEADIFAFFFARLSQTK